MEYKLPNKTKSKSFYQSMRLMSSFISGVKCAVITKTPEKTKKDFEYFTGRKLALKKDNKRVDTYIAKLIKN